MFAIFESSGTQHKVSVGDILSLQKIDSPVGSCLQFKKVCLLETEEGKLQIGTPVLPAVEVEAEVLRQYRDKKIRIIKFRRRKHSMKHQGHRQYLTEIKITKIKS